MRPLCLLEQLPYKVGCPIVQPFALKQLRIPEDGRQGIVQLVGETGGHRAKRRELLALLGIAFHVLHAGRHRAEDLARDRRFANNPLVKERGLRFYAGVPLRSNNLAIGSLCILDIKPRRMTEREKRLLEVIAEDVMEEIQRRESVGPRSVRVA